MFEGVISWAWAEAFVGLFVAVALSACLLWCLGRGTWRLMGIGLVVLIGMLGLYDLYGQCVAQWLVTIAAPEPGGDPWMYDEPMLWAPTWPEFWQQLLIDSLVRVVAIVLGLACARGIYALIQQVPIWIAWHRRTKV